MSLIKLLGFAPDADPANPGLLTNCSGVVPSLKGMQGAPGPVATLVAALAGTCQGSAVLAKLDNTTRFFAGTGTKLYEAGATSWTDVSRATAYTPSNTQRWRWCQFGNVSIAGNGADTLQASTGTAFADIAGAPAGAILETVNQFVFALNTPTFADQWNCCGIGDYTNWVNAIATQCTTGRLTASPGPITAARKMGDALIVYKQKSMYFGTYVGPPVAWSFEQIPGEVGAMSQESVVNIGTPENPVHIFMGYDNFYKYDGSKPVPIGTNRVKVQVFNALLQSRSYACCALHDRIKSRIYFYYPVADSQLPDHCVVYNYRTDQWGQDDRQIEVPVEYITPGVTYDALGTSYASYDVLPSNSYDFAFLSSALAVPAFFDTSHAIKTLTGPAGSTSITTGDWGDDTQVSTLQRVRPRFITKPTTSSMTNYYRMNEGDSLSTDAVTSLSSGGTFDVMRDARWHRFMMSFTGDWESAGYVVEATDGGLE